MPLIIALRIRPPWGRAKVPSRQNKQIWYTSRKPELGYHVSSKGKRYSDDEGAEQYPYNNAPFGRNNQLIMK